MRNKMRPIHPGEHLAEFLVELGLSQYALAKAISVPSRRINEIVKGQRSVTADTALRLGRFFGMQPQFWLNLQSRHDMETAEAKLSKRLDKEVKPLHAA
ncbi:MAG TPA: HigA family addiction module antitoxin [Gammaproteobacteria bacterium]